MIEIKTGDCRDILPTLEAGSVQTCVTSPPYFGLRDYGTAQWEGGDEECEHRIGRIMGNANKGAVRDVLDGDRTQCKCGARRIDSQLGLEATPQEYIEKMVAVFRAVGRVLRDDGTLWLNMGDSYCSTDKWGGGVSGNNGKHTVAEDGSVPSWAVRSKRAAIPGLKPKDLCMMPARLALALQADGWYLRSEIIWHKPNPMPESVTDRPTKAHEMIYLLTKAERYFYNADAIRESQVSAPHGPKNATDNGRLTSSMGHLESPNRIWADNGMRNKRSVWTIATQPYSQAHFATFPEEIPKLCILAGSRVGDTVLDPFAGSGTVGQVALELGRKAILIELNPAYVDLARERTNVTPGFCFPHERPGVHVELVC